MGLVPNALSAYSYIWRLATIVPIALLAGVIGLYLAGYVATVFELEHIEKILLLVTWFFCSDYCLFDLRLVVAAPSILNAGCLIRGKKSHSASGARNCTTPAWCITLS